MISVELSSTKGAFGGGRSGGPRTGAERRGAKAPSAVGFGGPDVVLGALVFDDRSEVAPANGLGRSTSVAWSSKLWPDRWEPRPPRPEAGADGRGAGVGAADGRGMATGVGTEDGRGAGAGVLAGGAVEVGRGATRGGSRGRNVATRGNGMGAGGGVAVGAGNATAGSASFDALSRNAARSSALVVCSGRFGVDGARGGLLGTSTGGAGGKTDDARGGGREGAMERLASGFCE